MRNGRWCLVASTVLLAGCAGSPSSSGAEAGAPSVVAVPATPVPRAVDPSLLAPGSTRLGAASCAQGPALPTLDPSASFDLNDPRQRGLRALAQQYRPTPQRAPVPAAAVPGAEVCVRTLQISFSLLTAGTERAPETAEIDGALRSAGLSKIVVSDGPVFAASTGAVCIFGTFPAGEPEFTLGPPAADSTCRP